MPISLSAGIQPLPPPYQFSTLGGSAHYLLVYTCYYGSQAVPCFSSHFKFGSGPRELNPVSESYELSMVINALKALPFHSPAKSVRIAAEHNPISFRTYSLFRIDG